ncbi:hypothetical protein J437_LFUL000202 [Ladona fulva]|uniref:Uncharacterized protein n=1 Tax=Ladona fulva TaxID=123851 RepID=A0A8K0P0S4_LADFU|nr:hypothetical protein J437_LFUL000202 [Ladona fulva]
MKNPSKAIAVEEKEMNSSNNLSSPQPLRTREPEKAHSGGPHTSEAESPNCLAGEVTTKSNEDGGNWRPVGEKGKRRRLAHLSPIPSPFPFFRPQPSY